MAIITLRSQVRSLSLAQVKIKTKSFVNNLQKYNWDCGVAATAFLMENKGYNVSRRSLIKELGASKDRGTDLVKIVEFFKKRPEFSAWTKDNWSFEELKKELTKGKALMAAYQNWEKPKDIGEPDWGHYGVVLEIEGDRVSLFDPGSKTGHTELSREEFEKRWHETDLGVYYFRWALSVDLRGKNG